MKLVLVGLDGGAHVAGSLRAAAPAVGHEAMLADVRDSESRSRFVNALCYRLDRRPARLHAFGRRLAALCAQQRPALVLCTGQSPLGAGAHDALDALGIERRVWLTDDPFNPAHRARWFLRTLHRYAVVFSPRLRNLDELAAAGARAVRHLPFGYDPNLFFVEPPTEPAVDLVFVGGADADRAPILRRLAAEGFSLALYGGYWQRFGLPADAIRGLAEPAAIRRATRAACISLCLVRRANRDGHVMRSYEIAACGGVPLVEDTPEHRSLFGPEGEAALYFADEDQLVAQARRLLADAGLRERLREAAHSRIATADNRYAARLASLSADLVAP